MKEILSRFIGAVLIRTRRSLGDLYPDVVVEESHEDGLQITEHPIEQGAAVSDHAYGKPSVVTIRGGVSDSGGAFPFNPFETSGERRSVEFYEKLLALQDSREPFDIVTGRRVYKNMLLDSLTTVTDRDTEHVLAFTAVCKEVIIVATQVASLPPRSRQAMPGKTGGIKDSGTKQPKRSTAKELFG